MFKKVVLIDTIVCTAGLMHGSVVYYEGIFDKNVSLVCHTIYPNDMDTDRALLSCEVVKPRTATSCLYGKLSRICPKLLINWWYHLRSPTVAMHVPVSIVQTVYELIIQILCESISLLCEKSRPDHDSCVVVACEQLWSDWIFRMKVSGWRHFRKCIAAPEVSMQQVTKFA